MKLKNPRCLSYMSLMACDPHITFFAKSSLHNFFDLFITDPSTKVQLRTDYRVTKSLSSGIKTCFHESNVTGLDL